MSVHDEIPYDREGALWRIGDHPMPAPRKLLETHQIRRESRTGTRARQAYRARFRWGVVLAGTAVPLVLLLNPSLPATSAAAAVLALGGLWLWEDLWVRAGQALPLS